MSDVLYYLVQRADPWVIDCLCIVVVVFVAAGFFITLWKSYQSGKREDRYSRIMEKHASLSESFGDINKAFVNMYQRLEQLSTTLDNGRTILWDFRPGAVGYAPELWAKINLGGIVDAVREDLKYYAGEVHRSAIWVEGSPGNLSIFASRGFSLPEAQAESLPTGNSIAGWVYRNGKSRLTKDVFLSPDYYRLPGAEPTYRSLICVPVKTEGVTSGVLTIDGRAVDTFDSQDKLIAELYAGLAGLYLGLLRRRLNGHTDDVQGASAGGMDQGRDNAN